MMIILDDLTKNGHGMSMGVQVLVTFISEFGK